MVDATHNDGIMESHWGWIVIALLYAVLVWLLAMPGQIQHKRHDITVTNSYSLILNESRSFWKFLGRLIEGPQKPQSASEIPMVPTSLWFRSRRSLLFRDHLNLIPEKWRKVQPRNISGYLGHHLKSEWPLSAVPTPWGVDTSVPSSWMNREMKKGPTKIGAWTNENGCLTL